MFILSKLTYRFNMIPGKLPTSGAQEAYLMFIWKNKQGRATRKLLKRKNNGAGQTSLLDIKAYVIYINSKDAYYSNVYIRHKPWTTEILTK